MSTQEKQQAIIESRVHVDHWEQEGINIEDLRNRVNLRLFPGIDEETHESIYINVYKQMHAELKEGA